MSKPFYMGSGRRLREADFTRLAEKHGIEEARLRAVNQVEARGRGFFSSGAVKCLYEPHIAYRYSSGETRRRLVKARIAWKSWRRDYPQDQLFPRIDKCIEIAGEELAATASSWGIGQIMGFNHERCGYESAVAMVRAFGEGEAVQFEAMIRFIKYDPKMLSALNRGDWDAFAYLYNGEGYKKNKYDTELEDAYEKWRSRLANRPTPPADEPEPVPEPEPEPLPVPEPEKPAQGLLARIVEAILSILKGFRNG